MYRLLLLLLPKRRRAEYGAEMTTVFTDVCLHARQERGWRGVITSWVKEALGIARFSTRERLRTLGHRLGRGTHGGSPLLGTELQWAWRGVRSRGWTAAFSIALLAIAIAANGIVFSVADSLMFRRAPYPDADRLINITGASGAPFLSLSEFGKLAARTGLVQHLTAHNTADVFLTGEPEQVRTVNVTPELFNALRVFPRWGRGFTSTDVMSPDSDTVVISEALAIARFGHPAAAVGRVLDTTEVPMRVVGVMPAHFRFPNGAVKIWRGFTPESPLAASNSSVMALARLQDGRDMVSTAALFGDAYAAEPGAGKHGLMLRPYVVPPRDTTRFWALLGAVACLLLAACANTASVELAAAFGRARTYAIQRSLGASRWLLARGALWEGAIIVGAAALIGTALASAGVGVLATALPDAYGTRTANPIDLDRRVVLVMIGVACLVWIATALPVILFASGTKLGDVLKGAAHVQSGSRRAAMGRRSLTVVQVALAVLLLVGGALYVRTYLSKLDVGKGFDSTNLAAVTLIVPPQMMGQRRAATELLLDRLNAHAGVIDVTNDRPPQDADSPHSLTRIEIDGQWHPVRDLPVASKEVSLNYHAVLQMPAREGRLFATGEPPAHVVIDSTFAKYFWPGGAVGHSFRRRDTDTTLRVVGVVDSVRTAPEMRRGWTEPTLIFYLPREVSAPRPRVATPAPKQPARRVGGPAYAFIPLVLRLDSPARLAEVTATVRSEVPQFEVRTSMVDDEYAEWEAETLLQAQVITAFGVLAFLTAAAGIYGVMAFLVVSRTRELGVRMALGASRSDVVMLVLGSTARMAFVGVCLGLAASAVATRYVEAELFGISPTDPVTYGAVAVTILAAAAIATWWPARQAARVDPAITLRAD